jgi:hypothetical protein
MTLQSHVSDSARPPTTLEMSYLVLNILYVTWNSFHSQGHVS